MTDFLLTVGLEIHVELETKTKMFCTCVNDPFGSAPNTNVCPVCYGLPGALPVANKEAVAMVLRFGQAISATTAKHTFWARKNYFYPDSPKGYQISQSTEPLITGGLLTINGQTYHLHHAHLEEDAGKLMHAPDKSSSLVNYNRTGVPLLEIVTEPDFHSASSAKEFCQELQRIMRSLKISNADMEKGRMRCEANISIAPAGQKLGTKVEVKNINSFRAVEKAIEYELARQTKVLDEGGTIVQETRSWDEPNSCTVVMRGKETSADYRYFPEPDLMAVLINETTAVEGHLLPEQKRQQLTELGLHKEIIQAVIDKNGFDLVMKMNEASSELAVEAGKLFLAIPDFAKLPETEQTQVIKLKKEKGLSSDTLKKLVAQATLMGVTIESLLNQNDSLDVSTIVSQVVNEFPQQVADYKAGKEVVFQFLVGQVMAKTKGMANIGEVREELSKALSS